METEGQAKEILQVLRGIYQRHMACDFVIEVSEPVIEEFPVHKAMLAAFSGKFKKLLENGELKTNHYHVQDLDSGTMRQLIDYIYTGSLDLNSHNVLSLLAAAAQLQMFQVTTLCQDYLMASADNQDVTTDDASCCQVSELQLISEIGKSLDAEGRFCHSMKEEKVADLREKQNAAVKRQCRKQKRGRKKGEGAKNSRQRGVRRQHRQKVESEYKTRSSESDDRWMTSKEDDIENKPFGLRSQRRQNCERGAPRYGTRFYMKHRQQNMELDKKDRKPNLQDLDTSKHDPEEHSSSQQALHIEKLTFNKLKCSICHEVFLHYSVKVLHEKIHRHVRFPWLGLMQRKYMPLYVRQYFTTLSRPYPGKKLHRTYSRKDQPLDNMGSAQCDEYENTEESKLLPDISDDGARNQTEFDQDSLFFTPVSNVDHCSIGADLDMDSQKAELSACAQNLCMPLNGVLPSGDCSVMCEQQKLIAGEGASNVKEECHLASQQNKLETVNEIMDMNGSNVKFFRPNGSLVSKGLNGIKLERPEPSTPDRDDKLRIHYQQPSQNAAHFADMSPTNWHSNKLEKGHLSRSERVKLKGHPNPASKCECQLCHIRLPYSLCSLHCHQKHGFQYQCRSCDTRFTHSASYVHHMVKVHGARMCIKNTKTHTCSQCGRQFLFTSILQWHSISMHDTVLDQSMKQDPDGSRSRTLVCRHCGCAFKYKKALLMHLPTHGLTQEEIELEFSSPSSIPLRPKINNRIPGMPRKCPSCSRQFRSMITLRQHMGQVHGLPVTKAHIMYMKNMEVKKIHCQEEGCSFTAMVMHELESHMRTCHPLASYECQFCRYKTPLKRRIVKHIRLSHMTGKTCEKCGRQFHKHYHLKHHYYKAHNLIDPTIKLYKCPEEGCDYSALTMYTLDIHMRKHNTDKPFKCTDCGRMLKTEKNLEKHMNKIHRGIRPFICDQCGASYGEESELKTHMARHNEAKKYHCMYCNYTTQEKGNFQSHLWSRHKVKLHQKQTVFECEKCDYTTDRKTRFNQHMASHNNIRNFKCPHCDKRFVAKNTMTAHIKWTHMDKSMACDYCNHKTSTLNMLREHVRMMHTHRDVKPYQCAYCEYRCKTSGNCRKHCMNKHKGEPVKWVKVCEKYPNNDRPVLSMEQAPKDCGLAQKDPRSKRIFSYEPEVKLIPDGLKQKPDGILPQQEAVLAEQEISMMQHTLPNLSSVMMADSQLHTVFTPVIHGSQMQIVQQDQQPQGQAIIQQQQQDQNVSQHHQQQIGQEQPQPTLQQQYTSSIILNSSLPSIQQQQQQIIVMMQQQQSFKTS